VISIDWILAWRSDLFSTKGCDRETYLYSAVIFASPFLIFINHSNTTAITNLTIDIETSE